MTESKTKFTAEEIRKIQFEVSDKVAQEKFDAQIRMKELRNVEVEENILAITNKIEQYVRKPNKYSGHLDKSMIFPFNNTTKEYLVKMLIEKLNHPSLGYQTEATPGHCNCSYLYPQDSVWEGYERGHDTICNSNIISLKVRW